MQQDQQEFVLVSASNKAGEDFMRLLQERKTPYVALSNNVYKQEQLRKAGIEHTVLVNTMEHQTWSVPTLPIGNIYLFEKSLTLCCRYIQICRQWTTNPIYVITQKPNSQLIYKGLGANHVYYSKNGNAPFLIDSVSAL